MSEVVAADLAPLANALAPSFSIELELTPRTDVFLQAFHA